MACAVALPAIGVAANYAGRPLTEVLRGFEESSLRLVYSSAVVHPGLEVGVEPDAPDDLGRLRQVLAPLGLRARHVSGRIYAIVPTAGGDPSAVPPTRARPAPRSELEEIVVAASRFRLATDSIDVATFLSQADAETLPRLAEDSLKVLQRMPGAASNGVSGLAHLRGGEENETLIELDGLSLYEPFHLKNFFSPVSVLDSRMLGQVEMHVGAFTVDRGDRMSAIVDARSAPVEEDHRYELGVSTFHSSGLAGRRFADGRGQWLVSARRSNLSELADLAESATGEPSYWDSFARVQYELSDSTRISARALVSSDEISVDDEDDGEFAEARYRNSYLWATLEHDWSEALGARLTASYTDVDNRRQGAVEDPGRRVGAVEDRRHYDIAGFRADASHFGSTWLTRFGVEVRALAATYDYRAAAHYSAGFPWPQSPETGFARELSPKPSGQQYSAYLTGRRRVGDRLTVEAGLRFDDQTYDEADEDDQLAPRVNLLYEAGPRTQLRLSLGRFQQFQAINELQVEDGVEDFHDAQRVDQAILGLEHDWGNGASLRLEAYRKDYSAPRARYENLLDPRALLPELEPDRIRIAPESSLAQGVEALLSLRGQGPWSGWVSTAWSTVDDRIEGRDRPRGWDQTTHLSTGLSYANGPWDATAALEYHSGWPTTEVMLESRLDEDPSAVVVLGEINGARFPYYMTLDLRVRRLFAVRRGVLSVYGELGNALDRENRCCTDYSTEFVDGRWVLWRDHRNWLPLLPALGVLWEF
jgi:hypothetical protein